MMGNRLFKRRLSKFKGAEISLYIKKFIKLLLTFLLIISLAGIIFSIITFRKRYSFEKPINTAIVYKDYISVLRSDPYYDELILLYIDGDLTVDSSGGLGSYPLKNIYTLGVNEKSGEDTLKRTLMKNFHIPIYNVIDCRHTEAGKRSILNTVGTCTNVKDFDDVLYLISIRWRMGSKIIEKYIEDYGVVIKEGGEEGTVRINENIFEKLVLDFSQNMDPEEIVNLSVVTPEKNSIPLHLYDVIKLVGGRIVEETHGDNYMSGERSCMITGSDEIFIKNIAMIFGCEAKYLRSYSDTTLYYSDKYLRTL